MQVFLLPVKVSLLYALVLHQLKFTEKEIVYLCN